METMTDGTHDDVTTSSAWSSDYTSAATVSGGLVTGVAAGQADIHSSIDNQEVSGQVCDFFPVCNYQQYNTTTQVSETATVQISSVTLSAATIHASNGTPTSSTISVQVAHGPISAAAGNQTITVNVGTFTTNPASGVSVTYSPAAQVLTISGGSAQGKVTVTATVGQPASVPSGTSAATVVVFGTLTSPSPGFTVGASSNEKATLTVDNP